MTTAAGPRPTSGSGSGCAGIHGVPFGMANGAGLYSIAQGVIPLEAEAGFFLNTHLYVGGYFLYGFGMGNVQNDYCSGVDEECSVTLIRFGLVAHYHFKPDNWLVSVGRPRTRLRDREHRADRHPRRHPRGCLGAPGGGRHRRGGARLQTAPVPGARPVRGGYGAVHRHRDLRVARDGFRLERGFARTSEKMHTTPMSSTEDVTPSKPRSKSIKKEKPSAIPVENEPAFVAPLVLHPGARRIRDARHRRGRESSST